MGLFDWLVGNADKELEMVTALTYVAFSDGTVDKSEADIIDRFCNNQGFTGISQSTIKKGIERAVKGEKPDFSNFTDKEKRQLLKACVEVAAADGDAHENEGVILMGLVALMGYTPEEAAEMLDED